MVFGTFDLVINVQIVALKQLQQDQSKAPQGHCHGSSVLQRYCIGCVLLATPDYLSVCHSGHCDVAQHQKMTVSTAVNHSCKGQKLHLGPGYSCSTCQPAGALRTSLLSCIRTRTAFVCSPIVTPVPLRSLPSARSWI